MENIAVEPKKNISILSAESLRASGESKEGMVSQDVALRSTSNLGFFWHLDYRARRFVASILVRIPILDKFVKGLQRKVLIVSISGDNLRNENNYRKLANAESNSDIGYASPEIELETAISYRKQIQRGQLELQPSESFVVYQMISRLVGEALSDSTVKGAINFGASYGYVDSLLATKFSNKQFYAVDRSQEVRAYNETTLPRIENLTFVANDIFDFLESRDFNGWVLFHSRTLSMLTRGHLQKLYETCRRVGIRKIVGCEQVGFSCELNGPYAFSYEFQPSVAFRGKMFIHNYPHWLKKSGYKITKFELHKTNHSFKDFRLLSFAAEL